MGLGSKKILSPSSPPSCSSFFYLRKIKGENNLFLRQIIKKQNGKREREIRLRLFSLRHLPLLHPSWKILFPFLIHLSFFFFLCHYRQDSIAEIEKQFKEGLEGGDKMCVHERQLAHHLQKVQTIAVYKNIILIAFKHDISLAAEKTFFLVASSSFCQRFR